MPDSFELAHQEPPFPCMALVGKKLDDLMTPLHVK